MLGCSVQLTSPLALGGIRLTQIGRSGYLYIYDTQRTMILHPEGGRILKRDVPVGANRLFDAAIEGFEGSGETVNSRGVAMLLSLKRVKGADWILGAQLPLQEAFAPLRDARDRIRSSPEPSSCSGPRCRRPSRCAKGSRAARKSWQMRPRSTRC